MDIGTVKANLQKMISMGALPEEIDAYANSTGFTPEQISGYNPAEHMPGQSIGQERPIRKAISDIYTPTLEMGGMVAGGITGATAGTAVSPGVGTATGGVAGGAYGFAMGANVADRLDEFLGLTKKMGAEESFIKAGKDLKKGIEYELGGRIAGKGIELGASGIWKLAEKMGLVGFFGRMKEMFPKMSDRAIIKRAGDLLKEIREETPIIQKTGAQTRAVFKEMEIRTEPTFAQKTGSVRAAAQEQSAAAKNNELKEILKGRDAKINQEAQEYIEKQFPRKGTTADVVKGVEGQKTKLSTEAWKTGEAVSSDVATLGTGARQQQVGSSIRTVLVDAKTTARDAVKKIYAEIPEGVELSAGPIKETLKTLRADVVKKGGGPQSVPSSIKTQIFKTLKKSKGKTVTFDNLRDWRSQVGEEIGDEYSKANPNLKLVRRLKMLENGIDDAMDQMLKTPDKGIAETYRTASAKFKEYAKTFREGTVGKVLAGGRREVPLSEIPERFFRTGKMDSADDLVRAVGKNRAGELIDDFAGLDLMSRAGAGMDLKTASKWLSSNKDVLEKYGLYQKYVNIVKNKQVADTTLTALKDYENSIAKKILGTDTNKLIERVFSGVGKSQSAKTALDLLNLPGIKENPAAINGIKNSFKDFVLSKMENSGVDVLGNPLQSIAKAKKILTELEPAMRVLYKDNPKQINALFNYHDILLSLSRNKNVTYSMGSTTVEKAVSVGRETANTIVRNIGQLVAIQKGKGFFFGAIKNLWTAITGAPGKFSEERINAYLTEAIYNPEFAETLMSATREMSAKELGVVRTKFKNQIISAGIYATDKAMER